MTQQYMAGEVSVFLARLRVAASESSSPAPLRDVARLRHEAETEPVAALSSVVVRTLALTDGLCWDALGRGDIAAFVRQARIGAELREFGMCSGLLGEG